MKYDDGEFHMIEPFDVDNGELDGLRQSLCFVLGVEWQMVKNQLESGKPFERPIHSENLDRIEAMLKRADRGYEVAMHDDWPTIVVEASVFPQ